MGERGVIARGETSLRISFQYRGVQCREAIKLPPNKANQKYAARLKAEIDRKIELGTFNYSDYFPNSRTKTAKLFGNSSVNITVKKAVARYLASINRTLAPSTMREYESCQRTISAGLGDRLITNVTTQEIKEWMNSLDCSAKRVNNILIPLRGMFRDAYEDGLIERDPTARIRNLKHKKPEADPFEADELDRVVAVLPPLMQNMITFERWTGLRIGELYALTWADIDFKTKTCKVNKTITRGILKNETKTMYDRTVDLIAPALDALMKQKPHTFMKGEHVWIYPPTMKPFTDDQQLRRFIWKPALKKAGVRYRSPKQLRHTSVSTALSMGMPPVWVAKQHGHNPVTMFKNYAKYMPQELSEADVMNELISKMG